MCRSGRAVKTLRRLTGHPDQAAQERQCAALGFEEDVQGRTLISKLGEGFGLDLADTLVAQMEALPYFA